MKKNNYTKNRLKLRLIFSFMVAFLFAGLMQVQAQSITIDSEPAGPLYVGDTIEVDYTASGFSASATFYLEVSEGGNDTIIAQNSNATGTLEGYVPAGFESTNNTQIRVFGATGTPDGMTETKPKFGELTLSGTNASYNYDDETYSLYFYQPTIRKMVLPEMDLSGDSAVFEFDYEYDAWPDTLELVVEYSTDGGSSYTNLDTIPYVDLARHYNHQVGIPSAARTTNTILRVRQLYSNLINDDYAHDFYLYNPSVYVGQPLVEEGSQALAGSPFTVIIPTASVTNVTAPAAAPYNSNTYSGDSVYVETNLTGFTSDINYKVVLNTTANINDPVYELDDFTMENTGGNNYTFKGVLPADIPFDDTHYFWVVPYSGTDYEHGTNASYDFAASGAGNYTINGEEYIDGTYGIYFTAANVREVISPEMMVSDTGSFMVEMSRRDDAFSPEETEIVVEYSTDGSTYTELGRVSLNAMKVYTNGTTTFEFDIPAGAISNTTSFRIHQNNINAENLDQFYVKSWDMMLSSNKLVDGLEANYSGNWDSDYVNEPVIDLKTITTPESLFYPGTALDLDYEVTVGALPNGSAINAVLENGGTINLGSSSNLNSGTISTNIPAIVGDIYDIQLKSPNAHGIVTSNIRNITVEEVSMEIIDVTGNPERESGGTPYYFAGDEITVDYNLVGSAPAGVQLQIEKSTGDWLTIANDDPADETVTATIPVDADLAANPDIRLALADTLYTNGSNWVYYRHFNASDFLENENDSMINSAQGYVDYDNYWSYDPAFAKKGTRKVETKGFDAFKGAFVSFGVYFLDGYYSFEDEVNKVAPIKMEYSTDNGSTWTELDSKEHGDITGNRTLEYMYSAWLPEEAHSDNIKFRLIQNESGVLNFGENAWELYRLRVYTYTQTEIYSGTEALNLQQASVALGTIDQSEYGPGEAITVPYNVTGNFGSDVGFAVTLDDGSKEYVVDTSSQTGQVQLNTNIPVNLEENSYDLYVKPYQITAEEDYPVVGYMEDFDDDKEDMIALEGGDYQSGSYYDMDHEGRRSVLTKALKQVEGDSVYMEFDLWFDEDPYPSEGVMVEVTYDGGSTFTVLDTITEYVDDYQVALATADMNDQTHLRWVQYVNFGQYEKDWELYEIAYMSSNTNILPTGDYVELNQPEAITVDYPDNWNEFTYNEQDSVIYSGESMTLELGILEDAPRFSDQTQYIFYLGDGSGNVMIDYTTGDSIMLGSMTGLGSVNLDVPASIFKGEYEILATVQIDDPDSDEPFIYYEEDWLMDLNIYNPTLKTIATTKEAYRGTEFTVDWELQTGSVNTGNYYFHLWLDNDNDNTVDEGEILYSQQDAPASFVDTVPTDAGTGNKDVEVLITTDMEYQAGRSLWLNDINDEEWRSILNGDDDVDFYSGGFTNKAVSQDFYMTNGGSVEFTINYGETSNEFLESNKVILEYSADGGTSYTKIDEFPNDDYELGDGYVNQKYHFAIGELGDTVRFRLIRQNASYGWVDINNFTVTENSNTAPVNVIEDQISIMQQTMELGGLPTNICPGSTISLDYDITGMFGEDVVHYLQYNRNNTGWTTMQDFEVHDVTTGSGSFDINMTENMTGGDYEFRIQSYDATTENDYWVNSNPTEESVYLIPSIDFDYTTLSGDEDLCEPGAATYTLYNTQEGFKYKARNVETGAWVGDSVVSEYTGQDFTMTTNTITEDTELEIVVTAMSEDGNTTCATGILEDRIKFNLIPQRTLFTYDGTWIPAEEAYSVCEDQTDIELRAVYYDNNGIPQTGSPASITWYRDDVSNAVSSDTELDMFNKTGTYFAQIVDEGCKYFTDSVDIEVLQKPDKPTIVASGETTFCGGESVTISVQEDYPYIRWYGGSNGSEQLSGSSSSIDVSEDGIYRAVVSNYPLEQSCMSVKSDPIKVDVIEEQNTYIQHAGGGMQVEDGKWVSCGDEVELRVQNETATYNWMVNGAVYTSSNDYDEIVATQTGWYKVQTIQSENGVTCTYTTDSIHVEVTPEVEKPTLTLSGDTAFCAGEGVATLTATEGYPGYLWYGTDMPSEEVETSEMDVVKDGTYQVQVVDEYGCESDFSNYVEVDVVSKPSPYGTLFALDDPLCGPAPADLRLESMGTGRMLTYQLINMTTGQPEGDMETPVDADGGDYVEFTSDSVYTETEFGVMVTDPNFAGCQVMMDPTTVVNVNRAEIEVVGNTLYATEGASRYQWYRNDTPIMSDRGDDQSIEVMDNAEYKVEIQFAFDCTIMSETVSTKNATAIDETLAKSNILLYPNPVEERVTLEMDNVYTGELTIEVVNVAGQILSETQLDKNTQHFKTNIEMQDMESGVYFIHVVSEDNKVVKSIIKK